MDRLGNTSGRLSGRTRKLVVGIAVIALLAIPIGYVLAYDTFSDVPTSAYYHNSVNALVNAGITSGCGGSKYCPGNAVTRGQMAVFLDKLGNLSGNGPVVDALSVFGQVPLNAEDTFTVVGGTGVKTECQNSPRPLEQASIIPYTITAQLEDAPTVQASLVNVSADDPDVEDGVFQVCFSRIDELDLVAGDYRVSETYTLFIGGGVFASSTATSASAHAASAWRQ
jgi:S-layer family protein